MRRSFMPQVAQAISLRGKGSKSGERSHVAEHVPHWKHFLRESPPCLRSARMKSRSGSILIGLPFGEEAGAIGELACGAASPLFRKICSAVSTVTFLRLILLDHIPLNGFIPYSSITSMNFSKISGSLWYSEICN